MEAMMRGLLGPRAAATVAMTCLLAGSAGATEIGSVNQKDFSGAIGILSSGEQRELQYGISVYSYETVVTGVTATTILLFKDTSALQVGNNSRVVLDNFIYDPAPDTGQAVIKLGRGAFRLITGYTEHEDNLTIKTPTLSMVVRGTHLLIYVLGDGTTEVNVIEGEVGARTCRPPSDIPLLASEALTVDPQCNAVLGVAREPGMRTEPPSMPPDLAALDLEPAAGPVDAAVPPEDLGNGLNQGRLDDDGNGGGPKSSSAAGSSAAGPTGPTGPQGNNQHHGHQN
jgi:hypothetical protein